MGTVSDGDSNPLSPPHKGSDRSRQIGSGASFPRRIGSESRPTNVLTTVRLSILAALEDTFQVQGGHPPCLLIGRE